MSRTRRVLSYALTWTCLAGTSDVLAQDMAARTDTIRLRFGWPAGTTARIQTTRYREQISETSDTTFMSADYRMSVTAHPEGLLVSYDDFRFPTVVDSTDGRDVNALAQRAASMVPKFVVGTGGEFVRIDDVASIRAGLDSMMAELLGPDADAADVREALAAMLSEEALTGLAAEEWNAVVGMWIDADLELGAVYELEDQAPLPILPGVVVPMISEFSIESRTACEAGGADSACVELHYVSYPEPAAVKAALAEYLERLPAVPGMSSFAFEDLEVENEIIIVTEPATLRPHRMQITKAVSGVVTAGGERSEVTQLDVRTYQYTYTR
ncbi:MAG TPA: hypothetical protein VFZ24_07805 [Longimicrobiales bacterium]